MKILKKSVFVLWMVMFCFVAVPRKVQADDCFKRLHSGTNVLLIIGGLFEVASLWALFSSDPEAVCPHMSGNYTLEPSTTRGDVPCPPPNTSELKNKTLTDGGCQGKIPVCVNAKNTSQIILNPSPETRVSDATKWTLTGISAAGGFVWLLAGLNELIQRSSSNREGYNPI